LSVLKRGIAPETSGVTDIEFQSLRQNEFLTDRIIDELGKRFNTVGRVYIHSIQLYELIKDNDEERWTDVLTQLESLEWTQSLNLFPVHTGSVDSGHYLLGIVDMRDGSHCVVDPIGNDLMYQHISQHLCHFLAVAGEVLNINVPVWKYRNIIGIPRQKDSVHCGCY
jgi:hypothetical protein